MSHNIDVAYVAGLARLELTPDEKHTFQQQLEMIVKYVAKIAELDVGGVGTMLNGQSRVNAFRGRGGAVVAPRMLFGECSGSGGV